MPGRPKIHKDAEAVKAANTRRRAEARRQKKAAAGQSDTTLTLNTTIPAVNIFQFRVEPQPVNVLPTFPPPPPPPPPPSPPPVAPAPSYSLGPATAGLDVAHNTTDAFPPQQPLNDEEENELGQDQDPFQYVHEEEQGNSWQDNRSVSMDISDGLSPPPIPDPEDGPFPPSTPGPNEAIGIARKIARMLSSNSPYTLLEEEHDIDDLGLESDGSAPANTDAGLLPATSNTASSISTTNLNETSSSPVPTPSEPLSVERLLENCYIYDAAPNPALPLAPRTPHVLGMEKMAEPKSQYHNIHTAEERQAMYCGYSPQENPDARVRVDVELDAQPPLTLNYSFDIDSFICETSSLAVARHGLFFYPHQRSVPNITTSAHLKARRIRLIDPQRKEHLISFHICDIPNWMMASFPGSQWLTMNIFFPGLVEFEDSKRRGDGQGRRLKHVDFRRFFDSVFLPAVVDAVSVEYSQSYPKSADHALANSRAKYKELRKLKSDAESRQQNLSYRIPAEALPAIQSNMEHLVHGPDRSLSRFRNFFFVIYSKGTKLDERKSSSWDTTSDRFHTWLTDTFHTELLNYDSTFVDLGKAIIPTHTSIPHQVDSEGRPGQSFFWRKRFLVNFFTWLNHQSNDGQTLRTTYFPWAFLNGICSGTAETKPTSQLRRHGLLYVQLYHSFKDVIAAGDTYAFSNTNLDNISFNPRILMNLQKIAKASSCNLDVLIAAYLASRHRCHVSLDAHEEASFGVRQEYRLSLTLFFLVDELMRDLAPIEVSIPHDPRTVGWIVLPTQLTTAWYRWNLNKFCFGFELIYSINETDFIAFEHTRTMIMFLQLIRCFLGSYRPEQYPSIWRGSFSSGRDGAPVRHGLGVRDNMETFGYGWVNDVLDWKAMTISLSFSLSLTFDKTTLSGVYKKNYGLFRHTYDDLIAVYRAGAWLRQFGSHRECQMYIFTYLRQLCLRSFRRDVFLTLEKSLSTQKALRSKAMSGNVPLSYLAIRDVLTGRSDTHIVLAHTRNQGIQSYSDLFTYLWEDDATPRGPWACKGYRMLYQESLTTIRDTAGALCASLWKEQLRDHLRITHWLLPYPDKKSLLSKCQTGEGRWWSNYNSTIDQFNCLYGTGVYTTEFCLPAEVIHQWPATTWEDQITKVGEALFMHGAIEPEQDLVKLTANDVQQNLCDLYETAPLPSSPIAPSSPPATGTTAGTTAHLSIDNDIDVDALHATVVRRSKRLVAKKSELKTLEQKMRHWNNTIHRRIPVEVEEEENVIDEEMDTTWQPRRRERSPLVTAAIVAEYRSDIAQQYEHLQQQYKQFRQEYEKVERRLNEARRQWEQARDKWVRLRRRKAEKQRQANRQARARDEKMMHAFKAEAIARQRRVQMENRARSRAQEAQHRARSLAQKEDQARARAQLRATHFAAQQAYRTKLVQERKFNLQSYGTSSKQTPALRHYRVNADITDQPLSRPHPAQRPK